MDNNNRYCPRKMKAPSGIGHTSPVSIKRRHSSRAFVHRSVRRGGHRLYSTARAVRSSILET